MFLFDLQFLFEKHLLKFKVDDQLLLKILLQHIDTLCISVLSLPFLKKQGDLFLELNVRML